MLELLKNILQLILSPGHGWEDIGKEKEKPEPLLRKGLYPLLFVMALSEFMSLIYHHDASFGLVLTRSLAALGAYFVTIFIGKLIFDVTLPSLSENYNSARSFITVVMGVSLMAVLRLVVNLFPWRSVILSLLPLYVILVLYKANRYLGIRQNCELRYLGIAAVALVVVPILIYQALVLIYPA